MKVQLSDDDPLAAVLALVTDPERPALPDGRTAAEASVHAWPTVRAIAGDRAEAAIEGAAAFGVTAILRLAATRPPRSRRAGGGARPAGPIWSSAGPPTNNRTDAR